MDRTAEMSNPRSTGRPGAGRAAPDADAEPESAFSVPERIPLPDGFALRALGESDVQELHALIEENRSHLARWLPWARGQSLEDTLEFVRSTLTQAAERNGFQAAILEGGRIVGVVGFHAVDWQHRSTSIGYWLAEGAQGTGTMTHAVRAMVDQALATWRLNRVEIRADVANERSRALLRRLGFRYEGTARQASRIGGTFHDDAVYSMLATEWSPRAAGS
jgi:ribosomal-protein-serine acetyltransferase